jgi:hypothetical protein
MQYELAKEERINRKAKAERGEEFSVFIYFFKLGFLLTHTLLITAQHPRPHTPPGWPTGPTS